MNKILKILLFILGLLFCLKTESWDIDRDFGWHLRFGQDAWRGQFQYLDNYTWTHQSLPWTNHEWGIDVLSWPIIEHIGYLPILIFFSLIAWLSLVMVNRIYLSRWTISGLFFSFLAAYSVAPVLTVRPALFLLPFLTMILWTLERAPEKKMFYLWPFIMWLWSAMHGSWIFGFITINVFLFGQITQICLKKYFNREEKKTWMIRDIAQAIGWQIASFLVLALNPYGTQIWLEVFEYFSKNYFKAHVTEWIPSYTFPVFWMPLVISTVAGILILWAWKKKQVNFSELLVYVVFFYAAWKYKRNMVLPVLAAVPIFTLAWEEIKKEFIEKTKISSILNQKFLLAGQVFVLAGICFFGVNYLGKINWDNQPWYNKDFLYNYIQFPYEAADFLKEKIGETNTPIFNEFGWGSYLNWSVPHALVFLDGRGTATWLWSDGSTVLEKYQKIKFEKNGLAELEQTPVQYILLKSEKVSGYAKPDLVNRLLFPKNKLEKIVFSEQSELESDLRASDKWKLIYSDYLSNVWQKK